MSAGVEGVDIAPACLDLQGHYPGGARFIGQHRMPDKRMRSLPNLLAPIALDKNLRPPEDAVRLVDHRPQFLLCGVFVLLNPRVGARRGP